MLNQVIEHDFHNRFLISSFGHQTILKSVSIARQAHYQSHPKFDIVHLLNYHNEPLMSYDSLLAYLKEHNSDGINVSANHVTHELVAMCHEQGIKVGVWVRAKDFQESSTFYERMCEIGVDFICSDYPIEAMQTID